MRFAGTDSWTIAIDEWAQQLDWALWVRAAERITVDAGDKVPGPLDIDPVPAPSAPSGGPLREGWLFWWHTALGFQLMPPQELRTRLGDPEAFGPPGFEGLAAYPELLQVAVARWPEMQEWHTARKRAGVEAMRRAPARGPRREREIVRAVEAETGHQAAPFQLRLLVLPVADDEIRALGGHAYLVPERVRATETYDRWLHRVVRALS